MCLVSCRDKVRSVLRQPGADTRSRGDNPVAHAHARSLLVPLAAVARASELLADGDLTARASDAGPPEIRQVSRGLNRLAARIGELLAHERETLADLSHQLRTPLTALRLDAESLRDEAEMSQLTSDVDALTRTVNEIIRAARRPSAAGGRIACDAAQIVSDRAAFWEPLAEDQDRFMAIEIETDWLPVGVSAEDLAACVDVLLGNVFAHTGRRRGWRAADSPRGGRRLADGRRRWTRLRQRRRRQSGQLRRRIYGAGP